MLRLAGLPPASRFPRVLVRPGPADVELEFGGREATRTIAVPVRLLGADDLEAALLELSVELQRRGHEVRWATP